MAKLRAAAFCLWAAVALAACGESTDTRTDEAVPPDWLLTFLEPEHRQPVAPNFRVEVAISGPAVARGEAPAFELGYYVDDLLWERTSETEITIQLAPGTYLLRVEALGPDGEPLAEAQGDQLLVEVNSLLAPPVEADHLDPGLQDLEVPGL